MVVDGEGFVGCVRGLRDALAGLPVVVGLLPSSRAAHGVVARGYDVFGQGAFGDMVALSCTVSPGAGAARAEAMRFLDGVISVVGKSGMVGWLFRVLWRADGSLLDAYGRVAEGRMPLPLARRRMRVRVSLCRVWRIRTDRIRRSMAVPGPGLCRSTRLRARLRCHRSTGGMSVRYLLGMLSLSSRRIRFRRIRFSRPNPILSLPPVRFPMSQAAMVRNRVIPHNSIRHNPMVGISPARAGMHGKP